MRGTYDHIQSQEYAGVKHGRVQKKNNWEETPNYYNTFQVVPVVDRRRPGYGYRHLLMQRDVLRFIEILPEWDEIARELDAIVLAPGSASSYGYYRPGLFTSAPGRTNSGRITRPASTKSAGPGSKSLVFPARSTLDRFVFTGQSGQPELTSFSSPSSMSLDTTTMLLPPGKAGLPTAARAMPNGMRDSTPM
jgi:hypothetical protein